MPLKKQKKIIQNRIRFLKIINSNGQLKYMEEPIRIKLNKNTENE